MSLETIIAGSIVVSLTYLAAIAAAVVIVAVRVGGRREEPVDDRYALSASRFTIPVSLIVPLKAEADREETVATVARLLDLNYPQLEVIVVAEGLPEATWARLKDEWRLEAREFFYRALLATAPVRMMYRSSPDSRLLVVDKMTGTTADALNCGVNLARYRYVSAVEPGIVFDTDALLRAMAAPVRDPASVVGATSHVETSDGTLQRLRSIRSLMHSRIVWRRLHAALAPRDAVVVWRRDAIEQSGGFSADAADPHLEMMVRLQTSATPGVRGQVVRTTEIFGQRRARPLVEDVRRTARWQMAALQAVSPLVAAGPNTSVLLGYFFVAEVLTPLLQAWVILASVGSAAAGYTPWFDAALAAVLLACGQGIVTTAALLQRGSVGLAPDARGLQRLLLLAPLEGIVMGAIVAYARVAGFCAFALSSRSRKVIEEHLPSRAA